MNIKPEVHNWGRYIMLSIVVIFTFGGYAITVSNNSRGITDGKEEDKAIREDMREHEKENIKDQGQTQQKIHALELRSVDMQNLAEQTFTIMNEIKSDVKATHVEMMEQRIDITKIKINVDNLQRVD